MPRPRPGRRDSSDSSSPVLSNGRARVTAWSPRRLRGVGLRLVSGVDPGRSALLDPAASAGAITHGGLEPRDRRAEPAGGEATSGEETARRGVWAGVGLHGGDLDEQPACHAGSAARTDGFRGRARRPPATRHMTRHHGPSRPCVPTRQCGGLPGPHLRRAQSREGPWPGSCSTAHTAGAQAPPESNTACPRPASAASRRSGAFKGQTMPCGTAVGRKPIELVALAQKRRVVFTGR